MTTLAALICDLCSQQYQTQALESWIEANRYWGRPIPEPRVLQELEESA